MEPQTSKLPPLPSQNSWTREFSKESEMIREEVKPFTNCDHQFVRYQTGVKCGACHMFLQDTPSNLLEIQNGKLFHKGKPVGI